MPSTQTLGEYFEAWKSNHKQSDADLAAALGVPTRQLAALASEPVQSEEEATPVTTTEADRPIPMPPLPGELIPIADRHGANYDRLVDITNGRLPT